MFTVSTMSESDFEGFWDSLLFQIHDSHLEFFIFLFWYTGMLRHLDWLLNMLILLRYYSLALRQLSDLLLQVPICLLSGCGWSLECLRPLRHTVAITFLGAHQTSFRYMEGLPMNLLLTIKSIQIVICLYHVMWFCFFLVQFRFSWLSSPLVVYKVWELLINIYVHGLVSIFLKFPDKR